MYPDYYNGFYPSYYGSGEWDDRKENSKIEEEEVISLNQAIEMIKQSIKDEKEDAMFYEMISNQAPTVKEKSIIMDIQRDEEKHNQILRKLYYEFTGQMASDDSMQISNLSSNDYLSNLEKALFGELDAVKKYRKIMGVMPGGSSYTLLMSIMTDELRHADKYNFLISTSR